MQHLPFRSKRTKTNSKTKVRYESLKKRNQNKTDKQIKKKPNYREKKTTRKNWYVLAFTRLGTTLPEQSAVTALTFD